MDGSAGQIETYARVAAASQQPKHTVITGELVDFDESYPREVQVPSYLLAGVLATGTIARSAVLMLAAALRYGSGQGGSRRRWRDLRKGPEYLVTPVRVRDSRGRLVALEIHGYLPAGALQRRDHIRARVRRQSDPELPARVHHIANLTTGQVLEPRRPTLWSHLGPDLVLQAGLGMLLALIAVVCLWGRLG
jgi:hypothetical protein